MVPGGCGGGFWKGCSESSRAADSAVTFANSVESKRGENEDGYAAALGWCCAAAKTEDASNNPIAAAESTTRITPNGKEILV
jgi:hypothetical protein